MHFFYQLSFLTETYPASCIFEEELSAVIRWCAGVSLKQGAALFCTKISLHAGFRISWKSPLHGFNLFSYRVIYLFTFSFKEGSGVWYQEKYAEKWRQMITEYSATCTVASKHTDCSFPSGDNPLPQRITDFLLSLILLSQLLKQHLYILFFQRYSSRVTEGLIKGICYLSSYFILIFKSASTKGIK